MKMFDSHLHIINSNYPLIENNGFLPEDFTTDQYLSEMEAINLVGGVVVAGSFQGYNHEFLFDSLRKLGENFVGVANVQQDISNEKLDVLNRNGIVAIRFNLVRNGFEDYTSIAELSKRVYDDFGWHSEFYVDSSHLSNLREIFRQLPAYSIDHLGLSAKGLNHLYKLVSEGARVKATGFGRVHFDPIEVMKKIHSINPEALMFGTDLPSTRAKRPFSTNDIELVKNSFPKDAQERIFYRNAQNWYLKKNH